MSNCTSGCRTKDHESYGACLRANAPRIAYCNSAGGMDYTAQKRWDRDLAEYKDLRRQGIQPASTLRKDVERAKLISNETGRAWQA